MLTDTFKMPLHCKIALSLKKGIENGKYKPGKMLPAESELIKEFKVSRGTVRKAYDTLVSEGLVTRQSGQGSFVKTPTQKTETAITAAVIVPSLKIMEKDHEPLMWELKMDLLNGLINAAAKKNIAIELLPHTPDVVDLASDKDGFIILETLPDTVSALNERNMPYSYFALGGLVPGVVNGILLDYDKCFYDAINFLAQKGRKNIALFKGAGTPSCFNAYKKVLDANAIQFDETLCVEITGDGPGNGYNDAVKLFSRGIKIDAVFCRTDYRAFGVMKYLEEKNIKIPDDLSIMGFDNIREAEKKGLTSYDTMRKDIGRMVVDKLIETIKTNGKSSNITTVIGEIVERRTTIKRTQ